MNSRQRFVVSVFGLLIIFCTLMVVVGNFLGPHAGVGLVTVAAEGFKISVAALVGALSAMLGGGGVDAK